MSEIENIPETQETIPTPEQMFESPAPAEETPVETASEKAEAKPEPEKLSSAEKLRQKRQSRYKNTVHISGKIAKIIVGEKVSVITVCTQLSPTIANYPTIMFFGANCEKTRAFKTGDRVKISAVLQSYDLAKLKARQSPVLTVGIDIAPETADDFAESANGAETPIEGVFARDLNVFEVGGQITAIKCNNNDDITLTIRTFAEGRTAIIEYPYCARRADDFLGKIHVHQYVRAVGTVQTANVPIEPEETKTTTPSDAGPNVHTDTKAKDERFRTRKKQFYILYEIYPA